MQLLFQWQLSLCACQSVCVCPYEDEKQPNKKWRDLTEICVMMTLEAIRGYFNTEKYTT